jgi:AraC-like DNA-binding protein
MHAAPPLGLVAFAARERVRAALQKLPRRRVHVTLTSDVPAFRAALRSQLVDAVLVDLGAGDVAWQAAALAPDLPSAAWFGCAAWRAADGPAIDRAVRLGLGDVLADGIDDPLLSAAVLRSAFTVRFAQALAEPPATFRLARPTQRAAWTAIIAHGGRPVTTSDVAERLGVSREHLSRAFAAEGAPNLKRVIDFVRLAAASALAKNPLYDTGDVARVLRFASASHLATATRRIVGLTPSSLARLRPAELAEHFVRGHARSRG